jgi:hypothetical protein
MVLCLKTRESRSSPDPPRSEPSSRWLNRVALAGRGAGWSSPVARQAHNLKVTGSNPVPATNLSTNKPPPGRLVAFRVPIPPNRRAAIVPRGWLECQLGRAALMPRRRKAPSRSTRASPETAGDPSRPALRALLRVRGSDEPDAEEARRADSKHEGNSILHTRRVGRHLASRSGTPAFPFGKLGCNDPCPCGSGRDTRRPAAGTDPRIPLANTPSEYPKDADVQAGRVK